MTVSDIYDIRRRYDAERDKRLRPDAGAQYAQMTGKFAHFTNDPFAQPLSRPAVNDHVTVTLVGGGFAGLLTGASLAGIGITDVRIVEKGGGFGGVWYWNRYPGAQCDTASMVYLPLLEETGYVPAARYAGGPEILEHCSRIAARYDLGRLALFQTQVTSLEWDQARCRWIVRTDRDDEFTSQFVVIGTGLLHVAKLPGIPGIDSFGGHSFHTSRWDYSYTGGDPRCGRLDRLADKTVAIIGTGATSVQCIPHLARSCRELLVIQRTPASVDIRGNGPIDRTWFATVATQGWQQRWQHNFCAALTPTALPPENLVNDAWTDFASRIHAKVSTSQSGNSSQADLLALAEIADLEKMNDIRARVDAVVRDPGTARQLKPWYRQLCKRPCFHDEYLSAFNRPSVHLIDTDGKGVESITPQGLIAAGAEHRADCIIYATGFTLGSGAPCGSNLDITGADGRKLAEYLADETRSLHGIHVNGFPNCFFAQPGHGSGFIVNVPHSLAETARTIATVISHMRTQGFDTVDVTQRAEATWTEQLKPSPAQAAFQASCTPSYHNNEGQPNSTPSPLRGYRHGPLAYFRYIDRWRNTGTFPGLHFSHADGLA